MEKVTMTVVYADIAQFKKLAANLGSDATVQYLQNFYHQIGDIVLQHGGVLLKYFVDEIMFCFRSQAKAKSCCVEISNFFKINLAVNDSRLNISAATGTVRFGSMGHPNLKFMDVYGEPVDIAYKNVSQAKQTPDGIYFSFEPYISPLKGIEECSAK